MLIKRFEIIKNINIFLIEIFGDMFFVTRIIILILLTIYFRHFYTIIIPETNKKLHKSSCRHLYTQQTNFDHI